MIEWDGEIDMTQGQVGASGRINFNFNKFIKHNFSMFYIALVKVNLESIKARSGKRKSRK